MLPKGSRAYNPAHSARDHEQKIFSPTREPRLNSAVPLGLCLFLQPYPALRTGLLSAVPANAGTHNGRCLTRRTSMAGPAFTWSISAASWRGRSRWKSTGTIWTAYS
jgi:hypothetical protein